MLIKLRLLKNHVEAEKKLNDHTTSSTTLVNDLSGEFKLISTKGSAIYLVNGYSILNGAKYFVEDGSQNQLVFQPVLKYFETFTDTDKILHGNLKDCKKRFLKDFFSFIR